MSDKITFTKKKFIYPDGREEWGVSCSHGSISFWFQKYPDGYEHSFGEKGYGGVETHYNEKSKPDYLGEGSYHKQCTHNNGECWHDGTSLWASEHWIPFVMPNGDEAIWGKLQSTALENLFREKETP